MNKTALYLIYVCVYSAALLLIGKSSLREDPTPRGYFLCSRTASLPLCICTFVGTWLSAITILSLTGGVYEDGLAVLFYSVVPWFFGAFLLAAVSRRLYQYNVVTVPELFRRHYRSPALQAVYGGIVLMVYVCYLVTQYKGFGTVAAALFDIPYPVAVLMVYLFVLYTTFGGYRSVLRTDAFNLAILVVSLTVLLVILVGQAGGLPQLYVQAGTLTGSDPARDLLSLFNSRYTPLISLSMFFGWGLGLAANPQYMIRVISARNPRSARWTVLGSIILLALLYIALVHIGLAARVLVPQAPRVSSSDEIIVHLMNNELYSGWSGFFLFAVIGACVSTANSQLLLIASSFSYDMVRIISPKPISERRVLTLGRLAVFGGGTVSMLLALDPPAFTLSYGGDVWGAVGILLFPATYGALLCRKVTRRGVWASILVGAAAILTLYPAYYGGLLRVHPALPGVVLSAAALLTGSALDRRREEEQP